ncbi:S8 family peptidase [Mongoliibacter ruber]|uniref:Subtilase family protein n=1 Tax=Mongoliibacter ruber TaxID=1750599 RepID=A0A2T0WEK9_9BACT|nr:S8 family serine peptidase [Mongoliibacter ruber]PRY85131.1 subtilase family protein [Mongoliibacter ruber]
MRQFSKIPLFFLLLVMISVCSCNENNTRGAENGSSPLTGLKTPFVKGEIVVAYKDGNVAKTYAPKVDSLIRAEFENAEQIKCASCINLTELWRAEGIEYFIESLLNSLMDGHSGIRSTTPTGVAGSTGDENVSISLNYITELYETAEFQSQHSYASTSSLQANDDLIIAVLDSGIDSQTLGDQYLWQSKNDDSCFPNEKYGWNFTEDGEAFDIADNTSYKHGTLVNLYILEQLYANSANVPRILNVKVLNEDNKGTLFSLVCGVHYAVFQGASIINTSLGFYDSTEYSQFTNGRHPIMHYLHNTYANEGKILFVTAAGNEVKDQGTVRNLEENPFYPAVLSENEKVKINNVISVTTSDIQGNYVSPKQNYSPRHVDVAIRSDFDDNFGFALPFSLRGEQQEMIGSSFATAIFTGKIAAKWNNERERIDFSYQSKYDWIDDIFPPDRRENQELNSQVNRGFSYIRLNNQP